MPKHTSVSVCWSGSVQFALALADHRGHDDGV